MELLVTVLISVVGGEDPEVPASGNWAEAQTALAACGEVEEDVALAIGAEDADELRAILETWLSGKRHMLVHDRDVLKRAMKAYRKRLKATVLDAESSLGGGAMSSGRKSSILGVKPPTRYPLTVWDELARQGRLIGGEHGLYELPPG